MKREYLVDKMRERSADSQARVLLVDDSPENIQVLGTILQSDYRVFFATDGKRALSLAQNESPDLILLDVVMPEMDGYAVCRALKQDDSTRDIPVIFVTAKDDERDEAMGLKLGAIDYIIKPYSAAIVRARVRNHLMYKMQRDELERLSTMDSLTQLPNRRRLQSALSTEWGRGTRSQLPLTLLMIDVDQFKLYNDTYGHPAGDECLYRIATALRGALRRPADLVARAGGEEFVCLLPETDLVGARITAQRILKCIMELKLPHSASSISDWVSVSIGAAVTIPSRHLKPDTLIKVADECLYRAKDNGRNRVECEALPRSDGTTSERVASLE